MIGVEAMPPSRPRLVIVMVDPLSSSFVALLFARGFADAADLGCEIPQRQILRVVNHWHLQSVRRLRRHAEMHAPVSLQHAAFGVVVRVALRKLGQYTNQRQRDER